MTEEHVYRFRDEFYIPARMMPAIMRYVQFGIPPGDFLTAVIINNLAEAVARADDENLRNLPAYVAFFYNECEGLCWGSREKMEKWVEKKIAEAKEKQLKDKQEKTNAEGGS